MTLSRRKFVQTAGIGAGAALTSSIWGRGRENSIWSAIEPDLQAVERGVICIASNENPVGPGKAVLDSLRTLLEGGAKPGRYSNQSGPAHRSDLRALQGQAGERAAQRRIDRDPPRGDAGVHVEDQGARRHDSDLRGMRRLRRAARPSGQGRVARLRLQAGRRQDGGGRQGRGAGVLLQPEQPDGHLRRRQGDARRSSRRSTARRRRRPFSSTRRTSTTSPIPITRRTFRLPSRTRASSSRGPSRRRTAWPACVRATPSRIPTRSRRCASGCAACGHRVAQRVRHGGRDRGHRAGRVASPPTSATATRRSATWRRSGSRIAA